jgi:hypothetical protein
VATGRIDDVVLGLTWRLKDSRYVGAWRIGRRMAAGRILMMLCSVLLAAQRLANNVGAMRALDEVWPQDASRS